jgi:hypothetical protein
MLTGILTGPLCGLQTHGKLIRKDSITYYLPYPEIGVFFAIQTKVTMVYFIDEFDRLELLRYGRSNPFSNAFSMLLLLFLFSLSTLASAAGDTPAELQFKVAIKADGVYELKFDQLGYAGSPIISSQLGLFTQGLEVPIWIKDSGDGHFDQGDSLVFVAHHLKGQNSYFNEFALHNIYWLKLGKGKSLRMRRSSPGDDGLLTDSGLNGDPVYFTQRIEQENIRTALPDAIQPGEMATWYMSRLSHMDQNPYHWEVDIGNAGSIPAKTLIRAGLTGLSRDMEAENANLLHHRVELSLNGVVVAEVEWDGQENQVLQPSTEIDFSLASGKNSIDIRVPRRVSEDTQKTIIDVVLLNWVEAHYPFNGDFGGEQGFLDVNNSNQTIPPLRAKNIQLISPSARRFEIPPENRGSLTLGETGIWHMVKNDAFLTPARVSTNKSSTLRLNKQQADYLILTHHSLREAIMPLVKHHQARGLNVALIDVEDIYDEFNHGIQSPVAIRDFISHAWHNWQAPQAKFVLLVGDASWNMRDTQSGIRNLVPSMQVAAHDELAASDNGFVTIDGDDWQPDLAIGRIPAGSAEELAGVVGKLIRYSEETEPGPWRRKATLVSDRSTRFQEVSTVLAHDMGRSGIASSLIFPPAESDKDKQDQQLLKNELDKGQLLVHFLGHGGRFVWRTGPPDFRDQTDLFTSADIESLAPGNRLPFVLSMTCSSGPFDHPSAGSLAETFLRLPDRGAIGILAASWRVPDSQPFSRLLIAELTRPGASIGEAIMHAKQKESHRALVESYNLLGDPAMPLALPQKDLQLAAKLSDQMVTVTINQSLKQFMGGSIIVDWFDQSGGNLKTEVHAVNENSFETRFPFNDEMERPSSVAIYIWNTASGEDAMSTVTIDAPDSMPIQ